MGAEGSASSLVLEEASALALVGRFEECLALLEGVSRREGTTAAILGSIQVLRARVLIARGEPGDSADARQTLERLRQLRGTDGWRLDLALARLDHREGRLADAAALLKESLERFRAQGELHGDDVALLAPMLLREVDLLERSRPGATAATPPGGGVPGQSVVPDPGSLLRLIELGKRLADEADPEQLLRIVLHEAIDLSHADRGFVVLVRDDTLDFALAENLDWSEVEKPTFEVSRTLIRKAIQETRPFFLRMADEGDGHEAARSLAEIGARSVACVPMVHAGATLGVLYLDGRNPAHSFNGGKERLIELFASQAAAALDNARAHRAKSQALEAAEETIRRRRRDEERRERYFELIGASDEMQDLYRKIDLVVPTDMPVLILGETGTGKELVARRIHMGGPRREREFVATNCASMAETLLESELFGHERGAFTGADRARPGLFELAHRGTLFLDEVGDMSPRMQADLLRALQSGEVRRIGGRETKHVDVRVIAATHRDLAELIRRGEFRQDLYFRLNVLSLHLPPLRNHPDDIPLLAGELLGRLAADGRPAPVVSERAMRRLVAYSWPGNVRELENVVRRLLVQRVPTIEEEHLPAEILRPHAQFDRAGSLRRLEDDAIRGAVEAAGGRRADAARLLGINRKTLYLKMKRLGLDR